MTSQTRIPRQKRAIDTKEKIIASGFKLICLKGYHNTNTSQIAKAAGVSTGIIYSYFSDKREIFIEGIKEYAKNIMYPMVNFIIEISNTSDIELCLNKIIDFYIKNHTISRDAHEELVSMSHSDEEIAKFFYDTEVEITEKVVEVLIQNNFESENLKEKVHLVIGLLENLCHEIAYHKHKNMDYNIMKSEAIRVCLFLLK